MSSPERLLRDLIAIPSVNPAFLPPRDPHAGEGRVAEFLAREARRAGLDVEIQRVLPGRANVLARLTPPGRPRRRILLAPHMDTVGGTSAHLFTPRQRQGRIYGRGACDTKGSIAVMFSALAELARSSRRPAQTEIVLAALVDEESGQAGSRALVRRRFRADLAIVGEPTRLRVVTAHKGDLWLQLETRGKAAHGARPDLGVNAVHLMARVVDALETDYAAELKRRHRHPFLGHATISTGFIAGGRQPNIVPDRCLVRVDRRTVPGETDAAAKRELLGFLRRRGLAVALADHKDGAPAPPLETNPRLPLVRELLRCAGQRQPAGAHFFSDAGVLGAGGIPSVLFGPGDIAQAHTEEEWVELWQLERGRDVLLRFLRGLA
jgi:acetylornithine deacetylase/succinyl-diaminopimelate desuccinylase-like protein